MNAKQKAWLIGLFMRLAAAVPTEKVSDWCERCVVFNEPNCRGPFSFAGREYLREPLDWYGDENSTDMVLCFGTRTGKTRILFGGKAWMLRNYPRRMLCVMPNTHGTGGAQNVSRTRWQPMLRASEELAAMIPFGPERHQFKSLQQILGGSIVDWAGSNSPANLASNPASYVEQDEVDKYKRLGDREADPAKLADERCKEFSNPKRAKASTPTLVSGLIWQELMKTDLRRRFGPCPHCHKLVAFAWSKQFTLLPTANVGFVRWDNEARRKNGDWDLGRVVRSARIECPHCNGHILDNHKTRMDREGVWQPTKEGAPKMAGFHLSSLYSASVQTNFGQMAMRFLTAKRSIAGLQGFINSDLAEPYQAQDTISNRVELVSDKLEVTADWKKIMTADCQQKSPHFWYVAQAWDGLKRTEILDAQSCDTWDELRAAQTGNGVPDVGVAVDSGFGAKSDAEVYRNCATYCEIVPQAMREIPEALGWMPTKGMPGHKRWLEQGTGVLLPYCLRKVDPFMGTADAGKVSMGLFEFADAFFKDILENLRNGQGGFRWVVSQKAATEVFWRHMDGQIKTVKVNKFNGRATPCWVGRHRYWPDHLFDCAVMNVAIATFYNILPLGGVEPAMEVKEETK